VKPGVRALPATPAKRQALAGDRPEF